MATKVFSETQCRPVSSNMLSCTKTSINLLRWLSLAFNANSTLFQLHNGTQISLPCSWSSKPDLSDSLQVETVMEMETWLLCHKACNRQSDGWKSNLDTGSVTHCINQTLCAVIFIWHCKFWNYVNYIGTSWVQVFQILNVFVTSSIKSKNPKNAMLEI